MAVEGWTITEHAHDLISGIDRYRVGDLLTLLYLAKGVGFALTFWDFKPSEARILVKAGLITRTLIPGVYWIEDKAEEFREMWWKGCSDNWWRNHRG